MPALSQLLLLLLMGALAVNLAAHGWGGVHAKLSALFLGKARPELLRG
jgi:hypothetical protein